MAEHQHTVFFLPSPHELLPVCVWGGVLINFADTKIVGSSS